MKFSGMVALTFLLNSFSSGAYSQLWKKYSDSAKIFSDQGNTNKAIEYYNTAKEELKKDSAVTGSYARVCNSLGNTYLAMGKYENAEPFFLEARQIREKVFGKMHPDYAASCNNLGVLYENMGKYEKAEPFHIEAKEIRKRVLGTEHPSYAGSCNNLAVVYMRKGEYNKAEPLYIKARQIRAATPGKESADYAGSCNNLAALYMDMGQYDKAEPLYIEARQIRAKTPGKESPEYSASSNNLALLYLYMGQYDKAEPLFLEGIQIDIITVGKQHPVYAIDCDNLALLYKEIGQHEKAESLHLESRQIKEKVFGRDHPDYARSCNNLGGLYLTMHQYDKAESFDKEALQIREKVLGKWHPDYARSCNNLAAVYATIGEFEKAAPFFLEARQVREKALGKEHPDYAISCSNLGSLYSDVGDFRKAEPFFLEAREVRKKALGTSHPNYSATCYDIAALYRNMHKFEKANDFYREAIQSKNIQLKKFFQFTSEVEKQFYHKQNFHHENRFFSFYSTDYPALKQGFSYDVSLARRNMILSSSQQLRNAVYNTSDTGIRNTYTTWINVRNQLSFWYTKPIANKPGYLKNLEEQANTFEKDLTRHSTEFKHQQIGNETGWKIIQQSLRPGEAAIEFVEFPYYDGKRRTDSTYYIALLLRKNHQEPQLIHLFEKKQLDTLLMNKANQATDDKINALYTANTSLYDIIWKPLEKHLIGISRIYFASAGDLFKISFAALPVNDKQVLGDKYKLIQLNTTATVANNKQSFITAPDKIQLYGGVQYDADAATIKQAASQYQAEAVTTRSLPEDLIGNAGFQYLPGTLLEVESVKKQAGNISGSVTVLSGINATEESVKVLSGKASPSVLHIATHGFFFPDPKKDTINDNKAKFESSGKVFKQSDNPLFRSGLLFAGANNAWQGKSVDGIEDGILTAYEISNMSLPNAKLVVLSACETALGDIQGTEGVYGLQRAFKMAGSQNLLMSLWKIGDRETAEFMQLFYKNLFDNQSVNDAFFIAQSLMKNKYRNEPYKWAAWVLVR